jgi:hypothetical protein
LPEFHCTWLPCQDCPGKSCEVSGSLFDASTGQRIFGGEIAYRDQAGSFHVLAESGNDGTFSTNCSGVPVGDFPLIVRVRSGILGCPYLTNTRIVRGEKSTGVNLSVSLFWIHMATTDPRCLHT